MIFNSLGFLIFFGITSILYFIIPLKHQKHFLLITSIIFYSFYIPWHVLLLVSIIILNFYYGILMVKVIARHRKSLVIGILLVNIAFLIVFKYLNFLNSNIGNLAKLIGWNYSIGVLEVLLPLGISFYIFKCISYDIEVYRGNVEPEKNISIFMLYVTIYPELLAGPIDRPQNLLSQIRTTHKFEYTRVTNGLKLMAWGYFQKWVIADRLALMVNNVYDNPHGFSGPSLVLATFFFAVQIYCDFSAYSDIAIGAGQVLGFNFTQNFKRPYFSKSISEFWRRWHISLSTWLRDYLFLPIAYSTARRLNNSKFLGIRPEAWSYTAAALVTMFIAGLWHGTEWTFIAWGTLMGIFMVFSFLTKKSRKYLLSMTGLGKKKTIHKAAAMFFTFSLVCFSWIFFRANGFSDAFYIVSHLHTGFIGYFHLLAGAILNFRFQDEIIYPFTMGFDNMELYLDLFFTGLLFSINIFQTRMSVIKYVSEKPLFIRWSLYILFLFVILLYGRFENRQFIYLQF
jgi:D-alanyl-lipoteichoic acid acyltransferase DltB (MBOAT superfamily)